MNSEPEDELLWLNGPTRRSAACVRRCTRPRSDRRTQGPARIAKREFELAAAEFAKMPESAVQLNSSAVVHLALIRHGRRPAAFATSDSPSSIRRSQLMPTDSTLLMNNIAASARPRRPRSSRPDRSALVAPSADFRMLSFLHNDEPSRERVHRKVSRQRAVKKALAYGDKATLLALVNPEARAIPATIASALQGRPLRG
jgi:hypothetical protein